MGAHQNFDGGRFPCRLLVDLPNWLGDLMMALPATDRLIQANEGGDTTLHVRPTTARLMAALYPRARVVATPRREAATTTARKILNGNDKLDLAVTMRNAGRAKMILKKTARWSAGTKNQGGRFLLSWSHRVTRHKHQIHDADAVLEHLGLAPVSSDWRANLPQSLRKIGNEALHRAGLTGRGNRVGLAPGVAWGGSAKRWPEEAFGDLARRLRESGFSPAVVIGPGEESLAASVESAAGFELPVLGADLDAAGLASLLCAMDVIVGNDSGPSHTAAVFGVPAIALFGPTAPARTSPIGDGGAVMSLDLECAPCHRLRCPLGHRRCMRDLDPAGVVEQVVTLVGRESSERRVVHA